jgi:hypothetical protein
MNLVVHLLLTEIHIADTDVEMKLNWVANSLFKPGETMN